MKRRNIFKALTGLFAAKSLPAAPVKVPASLQVAKAAAATNSLFSGGIPEWEARLLTEWLKRQQEAKAKEAVEALPVAQRADCVVVHNVTTGSYKAMTKDNYAAERRQNCLFGPTPGALA
jgi:hypothetical protein